jgi:hypothetical protein
MPASRQLVCSALVTFALSACGGEPRSATKPPNVVHREPKGALGCASGMRDAAKRPTAGALVLDSGFIMAFWQAAREPNEVFKASGMRQRFWKAPVVLEAGASIRLSIPASHRHRAALAYADAARAITRVAQGDRRLDFVSCKADGVHATTGWPGGFIVAGPACRVPLTIRENAGRTRRVHISFGRSACDHDRHR